MTEPHEHPETEKARDEPSAEERTPEPERRTRGLILGYTVTVTRSDRTQEGE